jgi:hypothetical protein
VVGSSWWAGCSIDQRATCAWEPEPCPGHLLSFTVAWLVSLGTEEKQMTGIFKPFPGSWTLGVAVLPSILLKTPVYLRVSPWFLPVVRTRPPAEAAYACFHVKPLEITGQMATCPDSWTADSSKDDTSCHLVRNHCRVFFPNSFRYNWLWSAIFMRLKLSSKIKIKNITIKNKLTAKDTCGS